MIGYRGARGAAGADNNFGASEGVGLYIAKDYSDAKFFGGAPGNVAFPKPQWPLMVDEDGLGDAIHLLHEDSPVWEKILSHKNLRQGFRLDLGARPGGEEDRADRRDVG